MWSQHIDAQSGVIAIEEAISNNPFPLLSAQSVPRNLGSRVLRGFCQYGFESDGQNTSCPIWTGITISNIIHLHIGFQCHFQY